MTRPQFLGIIAAIFLSQAIAQWSAFLAEQPAVKPSIQFRTPEQDWLRGKIEGELPKPEKELIWL